jgi:hypothetical protein
MLEIGDEVLRPEAGWANAEGADFPAGIHLG